MVIYDPDQLKDGFFCCSCVNWYTHDSPLCCICAYCIRHSIFRSYESIDLNSDEWLQKMIKQDCIVQDLDGIWWWRDHVLPTTLFTLSDLKIISENEKGYWKYVYTISSSKNWMRNEKTCFSMMLSFYYRYISPSMTLYLSRDKKWFRIGKDNFQYMRIIDKELSSNFYGVAEEGDFLRINFNAEKKISYMYLIQRIAYRKNFKTIKTKAFEKFKNRIDNESKPFLFSCRPTPPFTKINPQQMMRS